ncbi:putative Mitochondrial import inner membrane translocase subunit TIM17 [Carpediemonas membranifera]|uniref:Putative Mitochondrial import inner membrane translocase subunit TIM17 n=1 Tax=Carpediemonas membranifera TaxID=201153 RepID=A0A8J6E0J9_9EUKA|nr:putative Mitochondrial import inner membrane translocase subunit TIM17 [Carpediemonas membranifera]|eukprot:KAG9392333.1 putative Mitochondrial import inner membrane translocase subunit TIM17 [Carpediemonas membranifera]
MWKSLRYVSLAQQNRRVMDEALVRSAQQLERRMTALGNYRSRFPHSVLYETSNVFFLSFCSSGIWHFMNAAWRAPNGTRISSGLTHTIVRTPTTATNFALWSAAHSVTKHMLETTKHLEGRSLNFVSSGLVGFASSSRLGTKKAITNSLMGMAFLLVMERVGGVVGQGVMTYTSAKHRIVQARTGLGERVVQWKQEVKDSKDETADKSEQRHLFFG